MLVADVAAAAAAEAEALAEASSLQTRNAAVAAAQADLVLEQILPLSNGVYLQMPRLALLSAC